MSERSGTERSTLLPGYQADAEFVIVPDPRKQFSFLLRRRNGIRLLMDVVHSLTRKETEDRIWEIQRLAMYERNFVRKGGTLHTFEVCDARGHVVARGGQFQNVALRDAAIVHIKQSVLLAPLIN